MIRFRFPVNYLDDFIVCHLYLQSHKQWVEFTSVDLLNKCIGEKNSFIASYET